MFHVKHLPHHSVDELAPYQVTTEVDKRRVWGATREQMGAAWLRCHLTKQGVRVRVGGGVVAAAVSLNLPERL